MREIKFRAYTDEKEMWMVDAITKLPTTNTWEDGSVLMQFTGLKDKNGVEIYEGDILKGGRSYDGYDSETMELQSKFERGVVEWCGYASGWIIKMLDRPYKPSAFKTERISYFNMGYCEVIGNIYENPEL